MKTLSPSEAKTKLSGMVGVSPDEYESWKETLAILSDKQQMREIRAGLAALRSGKARLYTLEALFR